MNTFIHKLSLTTNEYNVRKTALYFENEKNSATPIDQRLYNMCKVTANTIYTEHKLHNAEIRVSYSILHKVSYFLPRTF